MAKKSSYLKWPVLLVIIVVAAVIGFYVGSSDRGMVEEASGDTAAQTQQPAKEEDSGQDDKAASQTANEEAVSQGENRMTPGQLSKEKGVPEKVESEQGDFELVAVIEGEEANRSLRNSLQVVNAQRQRLAQLTNQYNQTDPQMSQQRELIAGEINQTRSSLENNLRFMAQNFGYMISHNYLLVPHHASLNSVIGQGKDQLKTVVFSFKNSESYRKFQEKADAYTKLKIDQAKAYRATQTEEEKKQPIPKLPLTGKMERLRQEIIDTYKCDPERTYLMEIQKSALYARRAQ